MNHVCEYVKYEAFKGNTGWILVTVTTKGRKTHLEAHHSQLRQPVHVRT